jgi:hypothetical protein
MDTNKKSIWMQGYGAKLLLEEYVICYLVYTGALEIRSFSKTRNLPRI